MDIPMLRLVIVPEQLHVRTVVVVLSAHSMQKSEKNGSGLPVQVSTWCVQSQK